ncbi:MAG: hypothetical protein Q8R28_14955 [Dehalococcoidia bacterium]|nr:hypothetical protein [Dehalococcoidia bacterium]
MSRYTIERSSRNPGMAQVCDLEPPGPVRAPFTEPECFEIGNEVLGAMLDTAVSTKEAELGFYTCWDGEKEIPGTFCTGEDCRIQLYDCRGEPRVGGFHTHPKGDHPPKINNCAQSSFSDQDLIHDVYNGLQYGCVSGPDTEYLSCWRPKRDITYSLLKKIVKDLPVVIRGITLDFFPPPAATVSFQAHPSPACDDPNIDPAWFESEGKHVVFYPQPARAFAKSQAEDLGTFVSLRKLDVEEYLHGVTTYPEPPAEVDFEPALPEQECEELYTRRTLQAMARRRGLSPSGNRRDLCQRLLADGAAL